MKFLRLVQRRLDSITSLAQPLRLSPPGSLHVIEGQTGAGRKPAVRFSVRMRGKN